MSNTEKAAAIVKKEKFEEPKDLIEIYEYAKSSNETLKKYIDSTMDMYRNLGITTENFTFSVAEKKVVIRLSPEKGKHMGHTLENQEESISLVHGGILTFLADASAGALAFSVCKENIIPITTKTEISFKSPAILNAGNLIVVSSFKEESEGGEPIIITEIFQGSNTVFTALTYFKNTDSERVIPLIKRQLRNNN